MTTSDFEETDTKLKELLLLNDNNENEIKKIIPLVSNLQKYQKLFKEKTELEIKICEYNKQINDKMNMLDKISTHLNLNETEIFERLDKYYKFNDNKTVITQKINSCICILRAHGFYFDIAKHPIYNADYSILLLNEYDIEIEHELNGKIKTNNIKNILRNLENNESFDDINIFDYASQTEKHKSLLIMKNNDKFVIKIDNSHDQYYAIEHDITKKNLIEILNQLLSFVKSSSAKN